MRSIQQLLAYRIGTGIEVNPRNLVARRHYAADRAVCQGQHAADHVTFFFTERRQRCRRIVRRGGGMRGIAGCMGMLARPHQAHDGFCRPLAQRPVRLLAHQVAVGHLVEGFDQDREADGGVEIALGNVQAAAFGHEAQADHQQEAQAQHHHGRVGVDKAGQRPGCQHHHAHGDDDCGHHDAQFVDHAHGGDDCIQ